MSEHRGSGPGSPLSRRDGHCVARLASPSVNADQIVFGVLRIISALSLSLFLAIHKVFLRKSAIVRTQIVSGFALADFIIVYRRGGAFPSRQCNVQIGRTVR